MDIQDVVDEVVAGTPHVRWSIVIGAAAHEPDRRLSTASIGKILLLAETARQLEERLIDPGEPLARRPELAVADSGLWQHLATDALPVADLAVLIAAVSDNYATNVLLDRVGLAAVAELTRRLGLRETALNDRVRRRREPHHPPTLSHGSARELAGLMAGIARRELVSPGVSEQLDRWLATGADLSMLAAALHLDPLAHTDRDGGRQLRNKTGTDTLIRADAGFLRPDLIAYAVVANWDAAETDRTDEVMTAMRRLGTALR
jgi:beta-lactamase class A